MPAHCRYVLVAGGLGERLGYSGIKLALPSDSIRDVCFLQLYIESILAIQRATGGSRRLPLCIMTSDDTHHATELLLEENTYFGMEPGQVVLLKQEKVPCLDSADAHLALDEHNRFRLMTKPHGHGDVHGLLHSSGLAERWRAEGLEWVCFFQDTNAQVFRGMLAALGVSRDRGYDLNSIAVPRKAKEAIGAIAKLTRRVLGPPMPAAAPAPRPGLIRSQDMTGRTAAAL